MLAILTFNELPPPPPALLFTNSNLGTGLINPLSASVDYCFNIVVNMRCFARWYHLYNLQNMKNTHLRVLLLVKLQALAFRLQLALLRCFSRFLNCTNDNKLRNVSHINSSSALKITVNANLNIT